MWSLFSRANSFPYEVLDLIHEDERTIWKFHKGKRKANAEDVSIFVCEGGSSTTVDLARSSVKRLKMLKHPSILKYIDSSENEKSIYLVTEFVTPLMKWFSNTHSNSKNPSSIGLVGWGLLQITQGLSFINNDGKLVHNNINCSSVYVTQGGEWKIFGFEYTSADPAYSPIKVIPQLSVYDSPELNSTVKRNANLWSLDMWGLGCLIWEVFNEHPLDKSMSLQQTSKIAKLLLPTYIELVGANPLTRPNPKDILERLRKRGQYFHNDLIETLIFIDEIQIKDDIEKHRFFSNLATKLDNIPDFIAKNKILPALLTAHEFSNIGSVLLNPIFKIGHMLEENEYQNQIVPCIVKMFSSTDRATRLKLLQQMETLADHLDSKTVNEQVFQPLVTGFQDTNPTIREYTVKSILYLAPKLNYQNLNVEVLKHFARLQSRDDQGGIRTNTTVCLGKMALCLHPDTRQKCLVSAFTRAMRDPFPPARIAGVTALGATQQFYPLSDVATKILPALSHLTLDPEKGARDAVFRVLKGFLDKLEKVSEDPSLRDVMEKEVATASSSQSMSSWSGWAASVASKFYKTPATQQSQQQLQKDSATSSPNPPMTTSASIDGETGLSSLSLSKKVPLRTPVNREIEEEKVSQNKIEIASRTSDHFDISEEAGDGWADEDDEDWGNLEVAEPSSLDQSGNQEQPNSYLASSYSWGDSSPSNDFFSSFESKPMETSLNTTNRQQKAVNVKQTPSWDNWEESPEETTNFDPSIPDDSKKAREEKRIRRQKEIEMKRAARAGPMKLGAKKF